MEVLKGQKHSSPTTLPPMSVSRYNSMLMIVRVSNLTNKGVQNMTPKITTRL